MTGVSVPIPGPLVPGRFLGRPNRFVVRCRLESSGPVVAAHLADPGRLTDLLVPGRRVWLRRAAGPGRKLRWSAVLVGAPGGGGVVSVDTTLPNRLIRRALEVGALEELGGWLLERCEWSWRGCRFDFLLRSRDGGRKLVLEVKSVTLVRDGVGFFPDAVTVRGARHLAGLTRLVRRRGWSAAVMLVVQRGDVRRVVAAAEIDPRFAEALAAARAAGVRVLGRRCRVSLGEVRLGARIPAE